MLKLLKLAGEAAFYMLLLVLLSAFFCSIAPFVVSNLRPASYEYSSMLIPGCGANGNSNR